MNIGLKAIGATKDNFRGLCNREVQMGETSGMADVNSGCTVDVIMCLDSFAPVFLELQGSKFGTYFYTEIGKHSHSIGSHSHTSVVSLEDVPHNHTITTGTESASHTHACTPGNNDGGSHSHGLNNHIHTAVDTNYADAAHNHSTGDCTNDALPTHSHSGVTSALGVHWHSVTAKKNTGSLPPPGGTPDCYSGFKSSTSDNSWCNIVLSANNYPPGGGLEIPAIFWAGSHTHTISTDGSHAHSVTGVGSAPHTHTHPTNYYDSFTGYLASADANHSHQVGSIQNSDSHQHSGSTQNQSSNHTHPVSVNAASPALGAFGNTSKPAGETNKAYFNNLQVYIWNYSLINWENITSEIISQFGNYLGDGTELHVFNTQGTGIISLLNIISPVYYSNYINDLRVRFRFSQDSTYGGRLLWRFFT